MNISPEEQLTLNTYQNIAESWAKNHSNQNFFETEFKVFKKLLPQGKLLEIGCGGGRDADLLIKSGYDYTGTDICSEFLRIAKSKNPGYAFLKKSVYNLDFPKATFFDGFFASAVLLHIPKSKIDLALNQIKKVVKQGGIGFISLKKGEGEIVEHRPTENGFDDQRLFVFYYPGEFSEILQRNGFEVLYLNEKQMTSKTTWLIFCVKIKCA